MNTLLMLLLASYISSTNIEVDIGKTIIEYNYCIDNYEDTVLAIEILNKCNIIREENNLNKLVWNTNLKECSTVRVNEITEVWSHTRPNGTKWYTIDKDIMQGENLAYGYKTADEVINAWMNSESHRDNLLYSKFKNCYIAIKNVDNKNYYAMEFSY